MSTPPPSSRVATPPISPNESSSAYYHLLLQESDISTPTITTLANTLLKLRISRAVQREMILLSGELRDEWKKRVGLIKGDWMARYIPPEEDDGKTEEEPAEESEPVVALEEEREKMSKGVDEKVENEFSQRLEEAHERVLKAVESRETMELEVFLGSLILDARAEEDTDEAVAEAVEAGLNDALELLGHIPVEEDTPLVGGPVVAE